MTNVLIGVAVTVAFFLCLAGAFYLGFRWQKRTEQIKLSSDEEIEHQKQLKGFENILNYDYDVAIGKRVQK